MSWWDNAMTIAVTCGSCKTAFRVKDEHAGKRGKCPRCQAAVEVPSPPAPGQETVAPVRRPEAGASAHLVMREILQAFQGEVRPVRKRAAYGVGVLLLSAALLVLPALYLALVGAVAYLLYLHATVNLPVVGRMRSWWALFFLYIGPLVVGAILLLFMVKPLFARRSRTHKLRTLEFGEEPLLFALVTRVAQVLGAPEPKRIDVDCQVNASAGFGSVLGGFFGGDLVLTIGLPLVAGLSIQQFAGVVAHELGHFAQGTAMRLSYVVRSVNAWFARIVYERDDWDEALVRGCEEGGRLALLLYLALFCVWLTRRVLWLLLAIGHALSCFLMRQMEFDADRNETRLVGTETFADTSRRLLLLDLVANSAYGLAADSWKKTGRLPDDLSALVAALADGVSREDVVRIERELSKSKTGLFDTHPAHGERLASARRENAPGVFHLDGPATRLFKDFPRTSRAISLDLYRQVIGRRVKRDALVPVAALFGGGEAPGKAG
jgi:Zn-dependent protease with chaperone function